MSLIRPLFFASLFLLVPSAALALPVARPFGDFPKAIVFTGAGRPPEAIPILIADGNGANTTTAPGIILSPLGDGSWVGQATVYKGSPYQYYFEFRIPEFEADSFASFSTTEPGGTRNQDSSRTRTVSIPDTATSYYVVYNAYGDASVWGAQGSGDTSMSPSNAFLANWRGSALLSGDADTSGDARQFNVTASQLTATTARLSWEYSIGGDGFAPQIEGAARFGTTSPQYGFRVLRAESTPLTPWTSLAFSELPNAGAIYSDDDNNPFNSSILFTDTTISAQPDSVFVYTVVFKNAYGMGEAVAAQDFAGGFSPLVWSKLAVTVDGVVDPIYGRWIGEDPAGDQASYSNLDLTRLWVTKDAVSFYFAFEVNADIAATPWGFYPIFIDTTGDSAGAPTAANLPTGSKNMTFSGKRPEYALLFYTTNVSTGPPVNASKLARWNGGGWDDLGAASAVAFRVSGGKTVVEAAIPRSSIGSPGRIWVEAASSGNGNDPALDTINRLTGEAGNDEWNGSFSDGPALLAVSTPFPPPLPPPAGITAINFDTRGVIRFREAPINPAVLANYNIFVSKDRAAVERGDSAAFWKSSPLTTLTLETGGLAMGETYWVSIVAVGTNGETKMSSIAYVHPETGLSVVRATRVDSSGVTTIEVPKGTWDGPDTYFTIEIMVYDEVWQSAQVDTSEAAILAAIHAANDRVFFDPTLSTVTPGSFSDTYSTIRQVIVRRPDGSVAPAGYFHDTVSFAIPYKTTTGGEMLEGTVIRESRLVIRKLNEGGEAWERPDDQGQVVDSPNDRAMVITTDFSVWVVLAGAGTISNFDQMVVYPNPFNAREYLAAGHPAPPHVTFAFMPENTEKIEIYNVAGERVRTLNREDASEFQFGAGSVIASWDAKNDYGRDVASGVYIFWARAGSLTKVGKVAVIK